MTLLPQKLTVSIRHITFYFLVHHPNLVSYPSYQYSPLFCPIQSLFQLRSSHLFISVTITTTNVLTDLLALQ